MLWKQELAVPAAIARDTSAHVAVISLVAGCAVVARVVFTATDGGAAVVASVSWWAGAGVAVETLLARPAILARVGGALVPRVVTVHSSETIRTLAQVRVDQIHTART